MSSVCFPDITVRLTGQSANPAFAMGATLRALRRAGASQEVQSEFIAEATSGDYGNVYATIERWVEVE